MDNGKGGDFISLIGGEGGANSLETSYTVEAGIIGANIYRFRYRSRNINGWSKFSETMYIRAATIPQRPPPPTFLWATADSISANLFKSSSDGGSLINSYELFRNNGGTNTDAIKVTTYDGIS